MAPNSSLLLLALLLLGSLTAMAGKWQDMICVANCADPNPAHRELYQQPVLQTLQLFLGEMLCFLPLALYASCSPRRSSHAPSEEEPAARTPPLAGWTTLLLWLPAACDLSGSTLTYIGLLYTPVSIHQMTRAALVLFVVLFSVLFLHRKLALYQWVALVTVMAGVALVGLCGSLIDAHNQSPQPLASVSPPTHIQALTGTSIRHNARVPTPPHIQPPEITHTLLGVFFILAAQVFTAAQFVIEEKLLGRYAAPGLIVVAFEGLFGFASVLLLMPLVALYAAASHSASPALDLALGWRQLTQTHAVLTSAVVTACALGAVNWCGISVTRYVGATARSLTDTARTLVIWLASLALGWESFVWPVSLLQVAGFTLLVYGTFLFNDFFPPPAFLRPPHAHSPRIALATLAHADGGAHADESAEPLLAKPELELADDAEAARLPVDRTESGFDAPLHERAHRVSVDRAAV